MEPVLFKQSIYHELILSDIAGLAGTADELRRHAAEYTAWMEALPEARLDEAYAPGKWPARIVLGHIIDTHIMLSFRLLSFARGEGGPLPGNDESLWTRLSGHESMPLAELVRGYRAAAAVTDWASTPLSPADRDRSGVANGIRITVRELHLYLMGHERHHRRILAERYGL